MNDRLIALYLYDSLVTGGFDRARSDIDLVAALSGEMDDHTFKQLQRMHDDLVAHDPQWDDRIGVAYLSVDALRTYKTHASTIAIISPGEPFHRKPAGRKFLLNWYIVREYGITLFGPYDSSVLMTQNQLRPAARM